MQSACCRKSVVKVIRWCQGGRGGGGYTCHPPIYIHQGYYSDDQRGTLIDLPSNKTPSNCSSPTRLPAEYYIFTYYSIQLQHYMALTDSTVQENNEEKVATNDNNNMLVM